ncbi:MAG: RNA 2',3'-cyclic phosphodiesterase [Acidimicrobiales bacterium]
MARLFVAVWPPEDVLDLVAALPRPDVAGVRWTRPEQWHVTLRFLGRVDEPDFVVAALGAAPLPSAQAEMGPTVGRFGQRVLHVPVVGLGDVAAAVVAATAELGEPPEDRPFAGHLTLARAGDRDRRSRVDLRPLAGTPIVARWTVDEVTLVESRLSPSGARYEVVERFPLSRAASSS